MIVFLGLITVVKIGGGSKFSAGVSKDGKNWINLGEIALLSKKPGRIGFGVGSWSSGKGDIVAEFDDLSVKRLD